MGAGAEGGGNDMTGFTSPNYTQVPNDLFDELMQDMNGAELKVVLAIVRQTIGYHRETTKFSLSKIATMTGLSYPTVMDGASKAEERGLIRRMNTDSGESAEWELIVEILPTSKEILPLKKVKGSRAKPIKKVNTPSKEILVQSGLKKDEIKELKKPADESILSSTIADAESLFREVTGMFVLPASDRRQIDLETIQTSIRVRGKDETRTRMEAAWAWWKNGKSKGGRPYSKTNTAWLDKLLTDDPLPAHIVAKDAQQGADGSFYA